ncbi:MAG: hypothetical protein ACLTKG_06545 [Collinsella intestinalis]
MGVLLGQARINLAAGTVWAPPREAGRPGALAARLPQWPLFNTFIGNRDVDADGQSHAKMILRSAIAPTWLTRSLTR